MLADPPTVEHVTYVEVIVAVVLVRAPVVVGTIPPKFYITARSTGGRGGHGSTKPPDALLVLLLWSVSITMAPDTDGCGPEYVTSIGYSVECTGTRRSALTSEAAVGGVAGGSPRGAKPPTR